jgi:hypothetical protein
MWGWLEFISISAVVSGLLVSAILFVLGYIRKKSEGPASQFLANSILGDIANRAENEIRTHFKKRLLELGESELTSLVVENPRLTGSPFQVIERDCRKVCGGHIIEPDICGEDRENRQILVFVKKEFDVEKRRKWLAMIERHVASDYQVIIASLVYPNGFEIQNQSIKQVYIQDDLLQLCVAFLTKFYCNRI